MIGLTTIATSLLSAIFAALFTHHLATSRIKKAGLSKFQIEAYADFLESASQLAVIRRLGDTSNQENILSALNNAKSRVITCGDYEVVEALVTFWDYGGTLEDEREILAYNHLINVMREKLGHKPNDLIHLRISNTLFKLEPSSYSFRAENKPN